eukprot:CAMPEP_0171691580 /NCGR_PEP_ID=MMETSP0991-20121206/5615_1 /TAXON_ID=483369 /ORGANISM="non described non described, Strain CCMP2098" /LENGTH=424 /DNA_ID=CAMNT_0012279819 /DNA_START=8 /DNA_END=1280 /DNA_ORIENTATION=-
MPSRLMGTSLTLRLILAATAVAVAAAAQSQQVFDSYVVDETSRLERASNRTPRQYDLDPIHNGPGLHDDFEPLFTRRGRRSVGHRRCQQLRVKFKEMFRLEVHIFLHVVNRCGFDLRGRTNGSKPTLVAATALYYLATGSTYSGVTAAMRGGMSVSSVMRHIRTFTKAVTTRLKGLIRFPETESAFKRCSDCMEKRSGIPGIIGAIDGSHIGVRPPVGERAGFINYKNQTTIILSAVVDPRGFFYGYFLGYPGKTHDAGALRQSPLWTHHGARFLGLGYAIYGDAAYPLQPWLLTGFRHRKKSSEQTKFNRQGSRARVVVECAFGKLKGQWRVLMKNLESHTTEDWNLTISTCCILHNLTITMGKQGWKFSDSFNGRVPRRDADPMSFPSDPNPAEFVLGQMRDNSNAKAWRNKIMADLKRGGW